MKKSLLGLIGSLALAVTSQVNAATINLTKNFGTVVIGSYFYDFSDGPKSAGPLFTDTVLFKMGVAGIVSDVVTDTDFIANGLHISLFDLSVPNSNAIFDCSGGACGSTQNFGPLKLNDSYKLVFGGTIIGDGNPKHDTFGDLEGHLNITAVPESSTLTLMFAGFGLLAAYSLRRRSI